MIAFLFTLSICHLLSESLGSKQAYHLAETRARILVGYFKVTLLCAQSEATGRDVMSPGNVAGPLTGEDIGKASRSLA